MPATLITPTAVTRAGVAPPAEASGDTVNMNYVPNDGSTYILVLSSNVAATAGTKPVQFGNTVHGQPSAARPYVIPAGSSRYIGPFDVTTYGSNLTFASDNAELKYVALQFP